MGAETDMVYHLLAGNSNRRGLILIYYFATRRG